MLHVITVCHMEPDVIAWSLMRFKRTTAVVPDFWTLLDNRWPIKADSVHPELKALLGILPKDTKPELLRAAVNQGGHGGFNLALTDNILADDYVLCYDPDSNPVSDGWLEAMIKVLDSDPTMGYVSLLDCRMTDRPWSYEEIGGHKVAFLSYPEMWNVTLFRGSALSKGMLSDAAKWGAEFYGHVEPPMFRHVRELGMRNGYMFNFREDKCPIPHPECYTLWKQAHALGKYAGNFDAWCKEKGIK